MYMDSGRLADLRDLDKQLNDYSLSVADHRRAWRTKQRILKQLRDPQLASMRERLMKAAKANDQREMWKITNQIKEHNKDELVEWWGYGD